MDALLCGLLKRPKSEVVFLIYYLLTSDLRARVGMTLHLIFVSGLRDVNFVLSVHLPYKVWKFYMH